MDQWVVVLDDDSLSQEQLRVCQVLKPALRGAVRCDDPDNHSAPICHAVEAFPAFCHAGTQSCVYGLRRTLQELEALDTLPVQTPPPPAASSPESAATPASNH